jgi:glucosamine--fructose-6-phosphate aminotransferase (isomerizing)
MPQHDNPNPYGHWMLREIHEQPAALAAVLAHYLPGGCLCPDHCGPLRSWLRDAGREIVVAASGSSRHAGLVAEITLEDLAGIAVDVEYASEYCYRAGKARKQASVLVVSQSGETADTLAALRKASHDGHPTLAITNVADSTMAREATVSFPTLAGRERAIPATKSFTGQLLNLYLLTLLAAERRHELSPAQIDTRLAELSEAPARMAAQLPAWEAAMRAIAPQYTAARSFLFLGRGVHYAIAREGALKLKESAYLHAEGYPSGELKHGPNALVGNSTPLVMLATFDPADPGSIERYEKVLQLLRDMREQGANILALANTGDTAVSALATHTVFVDPASEALLPLFEVVPLQLFAYCMAVDRGIDVNHPRNLTKAVLTE